MLTKNWVSWATANMAAGIIGLLLSGCASVPSGSAPITSATAQNWEYVIGAGDSLQIFVWRNPDLSTSVSVRPDGMFSTPLVEDLVAAGKTTTQLAREIEAVLSEYVRDPLVTVTIGGFVGEYEEQIRILGEATNPTSIPYRKNMTLVDLMIAVGGITEFAAGNRTTLIRNENGEHKEYRLRLEDLVRDGDFTANIEMQPGDILIVPEAWF